jgi:MFS superfamily sulfate permease-like transporter
MWIVGKEQWAVFCATMVGTLATDLLLGIAIGILVKFIIHLGNGCHLAAMFRPATHLHTESGDTPVLHIQQAAVFAN